MAKDDIAVRPLKGRAPLEVIEALKNYRKQNPAKYEAKKAALFARYGLNAADETEVDTPEVDPEVQELEALAAKATMPTSAPKKAAAKPKNDGQ